MQLCFPSNSQQAAIHLLAFNRFGIPYRLVVSAGKQGDQMLFDLQDDLPPRLLFDIGVTVGLMRSSVESAMQEFVWPITEKL